MHKFDVKYTFDNYLEYYKFVLIRQRILRDFIFALFFVGIAIYWWIDKSENTANNFLPIFAIVMGVLFPLMNLITLPMLKKQLHARQAEIDRTHIVVTFNEEEVIYENLTVKAEAAAAPVVEEVKEVKAAKKVSASMKKDELIAFAAENNIAIDEKATKAVIIEAIEAALK